MDLKEELWKRAEPFVFISREQFFAGLEGWTLEPWEYGGEVGLIVATKGPEMHFQTLETGKPIPRRVVYSVMQKIIDAHGYALTKTPKSDVRQHRFNALVGFKKIGEDEYDIHYRMDALRGRLKRHEAQACPEQH